MFGDTKITSGWAKSTDPKTGSVCVCVYLPFEDGFGYSIDGAPLQPVPREIVERLNRKIIFMATWMLRLHLDLIDTAALIPAAPYY